MFLVGHTAAGAVIASITSELALAFGLGWLSHYVIDAIPHGDECISEWACRGSYVRRFLAVACLDSALTAAILAMYVIYSGFSAPLLFAVAGSVLPDAMWGIEQVAHRRLFGPLGALHNKVHNCFRVRLTAAQGLSLQGTVVMLAWLYLLQ